MDAAHRPEEGDHHARYAEGHPARRQVDEGVVDAPAAERQCVQHAALQGTVFREQVARQRMRPCGGEAPERRGFLSRLPEMARTARQGRCVRALVPWREGEPFPIPELFCFASVGQGRVTYLFDGEGRPIMPK